MDTPSRRRLFEKSVSAFSDFMEKCGISEQALFRRSKALLKVNRTEEAIQDLRKWASMDKSSSLPYLRLREFLSNSRIREYEKAKEQIGYGIEVG